MYKAFKKFFPGIQKLSVNVNYPCSLQSSTLLALPWLPDLHSEDSIKGAKPHPLLSNLPAPLTPTPFTKLAPVVSLGVAIRAQAQIRPLTRLRSVPPPRV